MKEKRSFHFRTRFTGFRRSFFLLILLSLLNSGYSQKYLPLLRQLDSAISGSARYDTIKVKEIRELKLNKGEGKASSLYGHYLNLYEEYHIFSYDSANSYVKKMQEIANQQANDTLRAYAKIKQAFILISSGMFKEVFDTLSTVRLDLLNKLQQAEYYILMARSYYDLADYDHDDSYAPLYNGKGNRYLDSSLTLLPPHSFEYNYYSGLKNTKEGRLETAASYFENLMRDTSLSLHDLALTASTLSDIYIRKGETDTAIYLLIRAAISDIRSSTKETSATFNLASLLFNKGELQRASTYVQKAVSDALFYGARQRKLQLSSILPLIEAEKLNAVEREKRNISTYAVIITASFLLLVLLVVIIVRQVNKLKLAKKTITRAHELQSLVNAKLEEANKIKEEYIGYFFNGNSEFYTRIEKFKRSVETKIADRKLDEISFFVNNLNLKKEREELLKNFDQIFLKLFPNFIIEFNKLLKGEDQIRLKEGELLNTHIRIFALIRMGIHEPEKIAAILEYSVNTINTYKTKIKNKSILPNEDFERRVMEISSV